MRFVSHKVKAIPGYMLSKFRDWRAEKKTQSQLRLLSVRDLVRPLNTWAIKYGKTTGSSGYIDTAGLYRVDGGIFVHRPTGLCVISESSSSWPIALRESGLEHYLELSLSDNAFRSVNRILTVNGKGYRFDHPCFVFNVLHRKNNYYHFVIDNLFRLLHVLDKSQETIVVLHFCERTGAIKNYFRLIEELYHCTFKKIPIEGSNHIRIETPVYFVSNMHRDLLNSQEHWVEIWHRLKIDVQLDMLGLCADDLTPLRRNQHVDPKSWKYIPTGEIFKNNTGHSKYSDDSMSSLHNFGLKVARRINEPNLAFGKIIYVKRVPKTSRNRYLANEREILSIKGIKPVDFAEYSIENQIQISLGCTVLIGITGAGLTNAVYMQKGTFVIEITPLGYSLPATDLFENICVTRGIGYRRIFSTRLDRNGSSVVEIDTLKKVLDDINYRNI